jgi:hypothetical protein
MPSRIATGQIDLGSLKEFFLRPDVDSISGSKLNATGFYPYTGNPSEFAHSGYVQDVSGDISGWVEDSVSGVIRADLVESGTNLSGYTTQVSGQLTRDIFDLSGTVDLVSGDVRLLSGVAYTNQVEISNLDTDIFDLSGTVDLVSGDVRLISGVAYTNQGDISTLDTTVSNLDVSLRDHVFSDYLSKKDVGAGNLGVSGQTTFHKNPHFNKGFYVDKIDSETNFSTIQTGVGSYSLVESYGPVLVDGENKSFQTMTNYMRFPSPELGTTYNLIVGSVMYEGSIPE